MSSDARTDDADTADGTTGEPSRAELAARVDLLERETRRLRRAARRQRRKRHRRAALALAVIGCVAGIGAAAFPAARTVLLALAGTGVFTAVLIYYLTPEQFVAASVGERVYAAVATFRADLVAALGLQDTAVYLPVPPDDPSLAGVRLFVPQHANYVLPAADDIDAPLVLTQDERARGLALRPTGAGLYREFEATEPDDVADTPAALAAQLGAALANVFELVDATRVSVADDGQRVTLAVTGSAYGALDRVDHPVASFVATGLAVGLDRPVAMTVTPAADDRADYLVRCTLDAESAAS